MEARKVAKYYVALGATLIGCSTAAAAHPHYRGPVVPEMLRYPMATTVWMEARNQPYVGQVGVAWVIKNRVLHNNRHWGRRLMGVVTKRKQFSCHNYSRKTGMDVNRRAFFNMLSKPEDSPEKREWRAIQRLSHDVWIGSIPDNVRGATYYATASIKPYWRYDMTVVGQIADHVFFRVQTPAERRAYQRDRHANMLLKRARRIARAAMERRNPTIVHRFTL